MNDPRLNLPSASGYQRIRSCKGSWLLEQQCPPEPDTEESTSGTRIHACLAGEMTFEELSIREQDTFNLVKRLETQALEAWTHGANELIPQRENRLYMRKGFRPIFSGQPDLVAINGVKSLILDAKTGWGDVDDSDENGQMLALAVLLKEETQELEDITVGILHPASGMRVKLARYDGDLLTSARDEVLETLSDIQKPNQPLKAGSHCTYCRAKAICPELQKSVTTLSNLTLGTGEDRKNLIDGATLFDLLEACGPAMKMIGAIKAEASRFIADGGKIEKDGTAYVLEQTSGKRSINDAAKAFEVAHNEFDITSDEFLSECVTVRIGGLEDTIRRKTGITGKQVKIELEQRLGAAMEKKGGSMSLERVKILTEGEG